MNAKQFFKEEISGEPLTEEWIIYHLKKFAKLKCKEQRNICSKTFKNLNNSDNKIKNHFTTLIKYSSEPEI